MMLNCSTIYILNIYFFYEDDLNVQLIYCYLYLVKFCTQPGQNLPAHSRALHTIGTCRPHKERDIVTGERVDVFRRKIHKKKRSVLDTGVFMP